MDSVCLLAKAQTILLTIQGVKIYYSNLSITMQEIVKIQIFKNRFLQQTIKLENIYKKKIFKDSKLFNKINLYKKLEELKIKI